MPHELNKLRQTTNESSITLHATCVRWSEYGLLIRGESGSGKSSLALDLIDRGAVLVTDDVVQVSRIDGNLSASGIGMRGALEVRNHGIFTLPSIDQTFLHAQVFLEPQPREQRLPPVEFVNILGIDLPNLCLCGVDANGVRSLRTLLTRKRTA